MCFECEEIDKGKRKFLTGATAAFLGAALTPELFSQTNTSIPPALNDPNVIHEPVTFKNGADPIKGYLAHPKKEGRYNYRLDSI